MKNQVYIAGPLFTQGDRWYLEKIDKLLADKGLSTYLPHRDGGLYTSDEVDDSAFFKSDVKAIDDCNLVVAVLHGREVDSGTAWEIGYAYAKGKHVIAIAEDTRLSLKNINLMLSNSSDIVFSLEELASKVSSESYVLK